MMIPRISYFPLVYDKLEKLYSRSADVGMSEKEIWLSAEDIPLKWLVVGKACMYMYTPVAVYLYNKKVTFMS